jgi:glycerophosphoryl diester phosphodiesterase
MFDAFPRPTIFAHRGASAHAPENTLAAFELAVQQNASAIELDVKLSADGEVIVIHDPTVDRTTDGKGRVADKTLAELRELDAGSHFAPEFRGEQIPTLAEVFEAVGKRLLINIELTNYTTPGDALTDRVADLVIKHGMEARVMFSSFNPGNLKRIRRRLPRVPNGLLALEGVAGLLARSFLNFWTPHEALHPYVNDVTPKMVQRLHNRQQRIHVWTVNQPDQMRRLFDWGVDGIFTDDPPLARQILEGKRA